MVAGGPAPGSWAALVHSWRCRCTHVHWTRLHCCVVQQHRLGLHSLGCVFCTHVALVLVLYIALLVALCALGSGVAMQRHSGPPSAANWLHRPGQQAHACMRGRQGSGCWLPPVCRGGM